MENFMYQNFLSKIQNEKNLIPKCRIHNIDLKMICTDPECINLSDNLLCEICLEDHPFGHKNLLIEANEIFSDKLDKKIQEIANSQQKIPLMHLFDNQTLFDQLDTIFYTIEEEIKKILNDMKNIFNDELCGKSLVLKIKNIVEDQEKLKLLSKKGNPFLSKKETNEYIKQYLLLKEQFKSIDDRINKFKLENEERYIQLLEDKTNDLKQILNDFKSDTHLKFQTLNILQNKIVVKTLADLIRSIQDNYINITIKSWYYSFLIYRYLFF